MNSFCGLMSASSRDHFLTYSVKSCISVHLEVIDAYLLNAFPQMWFGRRKSSREGRAVEKHGSDKSRKILRSWLTVLSCVFCFSGCAISTPYESQATVENIPFSLESRGHYLHLMIKALCYLLHNKEKNKKKQDLCSCISGHQQKIVF